MANNVDLVPGHVDDVGDGEGTRDWRGDGGASPGNLSCRKEVNAVCRRVVDGSGSEGRAIDIGE